MLTVIGIILLIALPLFLILNGRGDMDSERFARRYPHSYRLHQQAKLREMDEQQRKENQDGHL